MEADSPVIMQDEHNQSECVRFELESGFDGEMPEFHGHSRALGLVNIPYHCGFCVFDSDLPMTIRMKQWVFLWVHWYTSYSLYYLSDTVNATMFSSNMFNRIGQDLTIVITPSALCRLVAHTGFHMTTSRTISLSPIASRSLVQPLNTAFTNSFYQTQGRRRRRVNEKQLRTRTNYPCSFRILLPLQTRSETAMAAVHSPSCIIVGMVPNVGKNTQTFVNTLRTIVVVTSSSIVCPTKYVGHSLIGRSSKIGLLTKLPWVSSLYNSSFHKSRFGNSFRTSVAMTVWLRCTA